MSERKCKILGREHLIVHETTNFYVFEEAKNTFGICMKCLTHSIVIGHQDSLEKAIRCVNRMQNDPKPVYDMYQAIMPPFKETDHDKQPNQKESPEGTGCIGN